MDFLFYIILWFEQKCVTGTIIKNSKVYCRISVCMCFVILLKVYIFCTFMNRGGGGYGMAGGCFTDVVLHSSQNYQQENATEPRRLPKEVMAA